MNFLLLLWGSGSAISSAGLPPPYQAFGNWFLFLLLSTVFLWGLCKSWAKKRKNNTLKERVRKVGENRNYNSKEGHNIERDYFSWLDILRSTFLLMSQEQWCGIESICYRSTNVSIPHMNLFMSGPYLPWFSISFDSEWVYRTICTSALIFSRINGDYSLCSITAKHWLLSSPKSLKMIYFFNTS